MKLKYIIPLLAFVSAKAEVNIDFENDGGYKSLGVYDVWEESPLRTGIIPGNWAITANPDMEVDEIIGEAPNPSATVLGAQRSRFGSNRMGVRIDLEESFQLTPTLQYVHVMLLKPTAGRVMLVGLGSREERMGQNPYCEQFWVVSSSSVEPGKWSDAVFPIKGVAGINIRSFVVVPDMESPHNLTEDFLFYVDNIEVTTSSVPRVNYEYYPVTGGKADSPMTRTDRVTSSISLKIGNETQTFSIEQQSNKKLYQDLTDKSFYAQIGNVLTPEIEYAQNWMHAYCYIDLNNDGKFSEDELVSYNAYSEDGNNYKNSKGENVNSGLGNGQCGKMPSFTLPSEVGPGRYRMRLKLDWNSIDPAGNPGNAEGDNLINDNGGMIADVMLNVCGNTVEVNDFQLNGEVLAEDGSKLSPYLASYNQAFTIKMAPEKGFHQGGADIKVGFNLDGEKEDKYGNPQYSEFSIPDYMFSDGLYTIPAEKMRGNLLIKGRMIEDGADTPTEEPYALNFPKDLTIDRTDRALNSVTLKTSGNDPDLTLTPTAKTVYQDFTSEEFEIMAGETLSPEVSYQGNAMHTYWYVDLNSDGVFSIEDEMLSYSYSDGKNSLGETVSTPGGINPSTNYPFTIPATTVAGLYRCRFKIDWNDSDPGGQYGKGNNDINDNGGYVVDFYLHVHTNEVLLVGDEKMSVPATAPYGQAFKITEVMAPNQTIKAIDVRYGYRLDSPSTFLGHEHWHAIHIEPANDGTMTLPAEIMRGTLELSGIYEVDGIRLVMTTDDNIEIYNLLGVKLNKPQRGLNIINGKKIVK